MKNKTKYVAIILILGLIIFLFIPRIKILAPEREIEIISNDGKPIQNAVVRQIWYQYSLRINDEEDFSSGPNGKVILPERKIETQNFGLLKGCALNFKNYFINASCCTSESIGVFSEGYEDAWFYDGKGLESGIITVQPGKSRHFE